MKLTNKFWILIPLFLLSKAFSEVTKYDIIDIVIRKKGGYENFEKKTNEKNTERDFQYHDDTGIIYDGSDSYDKYMGKSCF